jgi:hypothetical protein
MSQWRLAQTQERLALREKERDRLKVLHEVGQGHLTQSQAAGQLQRSDRGFRKLLRRFREKGDAGITHGLRNRASNRKLKDGIASKAIKAVKRDYRDFGPTLGAGYLKKDLHIELSRETVRQLLIRDGHWKAKPQQIRAVHVWRPRRSCRGELIKWDTSIHAWLEDRGPDRMYLIALIDDATNTLFARFVPADSTERHMRVLRAYLALRGRPQAVYTDKASVFQPTLAPGWKEEEPGPKNETQMRRAFRELGIEWIAAHSPQAKGRIERCFGTLQDRPAKGLRKAGAETMEQATEYLEREFLAALNLRFTVRADSGVDAHRAVGETLRLESILSHVEERQVTNDYTVAWNGKTWQIPKPVVRPGLRGSTLRVEARLDGTVMTRIGRRLHCADCLPETGEGRSGFGETAGSETCECAGGEPVDGRLQYSEKRRRGHAGRFRESGDQACGSTHGTVGPLHRILLTTSADAKDTLSGDKVCVPLRSWPAPCMNRIPVRASRIAGVLRTVTPCT